MAVLLILVVIAGVLLLYAADRARKLRARARQMSAMNERLDVAAAKVDEQQERQHARVRASAELTSVMPAIKRPPLTLPGVPGPAAGPEEDRAAVEQEAGPAAVDNTPAAASDTPAAVDDTPAAADAENTPDGAAADESPAAPTGPDAGDSPTAGDSRAAAEEVTPEPARTPEGTLTMGKVIPDVPIPAPKLPLTSDGTLIMPAVPGQGRAPADEAVPTPAPSRTRPRASQPRASQRRASPSRPSQQSTSQEQANRD